MTLTPRPKSPTHAPSRKVTKIQLLSTPAASTTFFLGKRRKCPRFCQESVRSAASMISACSFLWLLAEPVAGLAEAGR